MRILDTIGNFFLKSRLRLLLLVGVILALAVYALFFNTNGDRRQSTTTPGTGEKTVNLQLTANKNRLISQLPYEADGYTVEYFPDQDYFFIQINKGSFKEYKAKAEAWLQANGVEPTMVQIQWSSTRGVAP